MAWGFLVFGGIIRFKEDLDEKYCTKGFGDNFFAGFNGAFGKVDFKGAG